MKVRLDSIKNTEPKREHGDISGLKQSITDVGLICPLTIDENGALLAGRRRYQALAELGFTEVECYVLPVNGDQVKALEVAIDENVKRKNMTEVEEAVANKQLDDLKRKRYGERKPGNPNFKSESPISQTLANSEGWTQAKTAEEKGVSRQKIGRDIKIATAIEEHPELAKYKSGVQVLEAAKRIEVSKNPIPIPEGHYRTIVIDPPWPVTKILREVAPNQYDFDYPTMTLDEIQNIPIATYAEDNCHLFLWTTEKYLPIAFSILENWGFTYVFTMVWHKNGGFQPFNLPQYNCEFVLFGHKGNVSFLTTKDFPTCFNGERREHSRKPDEFYDLIKRVSPGKRLDMFSREKHDGYEQFGNEANKFE